MKRAVVGGLVAVLATAIIVGAPVSGTFFGTSTAGAEAPGPCGTVLLPTTEWLGGAGVDVYSNGTYQGTGTDCAKPGGVAYNYVNGVKTGQKWQGTELVNRLYLSKGWIKTTWAGSPGSTFYADAPSNLTKQANGSVSRLGPGDVVDIDIFHNGTANGAEVLVVNDSQAASNGTVTTVSQNTGSPSDATVQSDVSISHGTVAAPSTGSRTYTVIGVIHSPISSTQPTLTALASTSGPAGFATEFAVACPQRDEDLGIDVTAPSELSSGEDTFTSGTYDFWEQTALSASAGSYSFQVDCVAGIPGNRPQWKTTHAFAPVAMDITGPSITPTISPTSPQRGSTVTVSDGGGFGSGTWASGTLFIGWNDQSSSGTLENGKITIGANGDWSPYVQAIPTSVPVGATIEVSASAWGPGQTYTVNSNIVTSGPVS